MTNIVEHIRTLLSGEVFFLLLTLGSFLLGVLMYKRTKISLLQPILVSMIIIIPFLKITGIEYQVFYEKTRLLSFMLGPSVVALGYVLYEQIEHIRGNVISILTSVFVGSLVGILSVVLIA